LTSSSMARTRNEKERQLATATFPKAPKSSSGAPVRHAPGPPGWSALQVAAEARRDPLAALVNVASPTASLPAIQLLPGAGLMVVSSAEHARHILI
jgi:hypothetical protein